VKPEAMRQRCQDIRTGRLKTDDERVTDIEQEVDRLRLVLESDKAPVPPGDEKPALWLIGWLIFEESWASLQRVQPAYESFADPSERLASEWAAAMILRLADAARRLPWPEWAPRALGAIRCQALAASKRDTERGYDDAWVLHREGREKYNVYWESLDGAPHHLRLALDETLLQLALAETGTACRTAERVIGRWAEGIDDGSWTAADEGEWMQRMFRELCDGASGGDAALDMVANIEREHSLVQAVDEDRLALVTSYRNPGIMTARAFLLLVPMCAVMERFGRLPPEEHVTWREAASAFMRRFQDAYRFIERPVVREDGSAIELSVDHKRSLIQIRLNAGLVHPNLPLPSTLDFDTCLAMSSMGREAVEAVSNWLATTQGGKRRGDANVIGSATMPTYVEGVTICTQWFGPDPNDESYRDWRRRWFSLDRYNGEPGRRERVEQVLGPAVE
jgi:hypothetical protein